MDKLNLTGARELLARLRRLPEEMDVSTSGSTRWRSEVREGRRHQQRLAELTDVVQELLLPIAQRDQDAASTRSSPRTSTTWPDGPARLRPHRPAQDRRRATSRPSSGPHRDALASAGLLVPGRERRDHLWASLVVREDPRVARRSPRAPQAWQVLRRAGRLGRATALISHEFFCWPRAEQARRMVDELAPAEVHLVVTAREPLGLFTSSWQESLKNKGTSRSRTTRGPSPTTLARSGTGARSTSAWSSSAGATSSRPTGCT